MKRTIKTQILNPNRVRIETYLNGVLINSIETSDHPYLNAMKQGLIQTEDEIHVDSLYLTATKGKYDV